MAGGARQERANGAAAGAEPRGLKTAKEGKGFGETGVWGARGFPQLPATVKKGGSGGGQGYGKDTQRDTQRDTRPHGLAARGT